MQWHVAYDNAYLSSLVIDQIRCDIDTLEAKPGQERHLLISSNQSFYKRVIQPGLQLRQLSQRKKESVEQARHPYTWSLMARDEWHTAKGENTIISEYFRKARTRRSKPNHPTQHEQSKKGKRKATEDPNGYVAQHLGRPLKIAISGTPIEGSPDDLRHHYTGDIDEERARQDTNKTICTPEELKRLSTTYQKIVVDLGSVSDEETRRIMNQRLKAYAREQNRLLTPIMISRKGHDKFFEYTIIPLAPMQVMEIACPVKEEYIESIEKCAAQTKQDLQAEYDIRVKRWEDNGRQGPKPELLNRFAQSGAMYYLRLAGDFAAIPDLHRKYPAWTFHADEVYKIDWDRVPKDNLYATHLKTLVKSSAKLESLNKILAGMKERSSKWIARGDSKEKMVLTTAHPAVLGILYLYFKVYRKDFHVVMISASMDIGKRVQIINGFCRRDDSPYYDMASNADILLTTTALVGTGLNLTDSNVFVQMDPLWMQKDQRQAFARVHRTGQKRPTHLYLLYSLGNPIERGCLDR